VRDLQQRLAAAAAPQARPPRHPAPAAARRPRLAGVAGGVPARDGDPVRRRRRLPRRRRLRLHPVHRDRPLHQGLRPLRPEDRDRARPRRARGRRLRHRAHLPPLAGQGAQRLRLRRPHLQLGERCGAGGRRLVRQRPGRRGARRRGAARPARGDALVEGVRDGARALRRRRRDPHPPVGRREARLGPAARPLRRALARAAREHRALRVRLPGRARAHPAPRHRRAPRPPARGARRPRRSGPRLQRNRDLAAAVSPRRAGVGLHRRPPRPARQHDGRRDRPVDPGDLRAEV
ncbi:MAG: hypothetical protein AVDCRST_MAG40-1990, partial [uncultured Gemmatimonadaceae bacterium]